MKKTILILLLSSFFALPVVAAPKIIGFDTFLKRVIDEYRKINREELKAEMRYKRNISDNGVELNLLGVNAEKNNNDFIYNGSEKVKYGKISLRKKNLYGTTAEVSYEYGNSEENQIDKSLVFFQEEAESNKKNDAQRLKLQISQSILKDYLVGYYNEQAEKVVFEDEKERIASEESYILTRAISLYLKYMINQKRISANSLTKEKIRGYISEIAQADASIETTLKVKTMELSLAKFESADIFLKDAILNEKFDMLSMIKERETKEGIEFEEITREKLVEKYKDLLSKVYASKLKRMENYIKAIEIKIKQKENNNSPDIVLFGSAEAYKSKAKENDRSYDVNKWDKPTYEIGFNLNYSFFDFENTYDVKLTEATLLTEKANFANKKDEYEDRITLKMKEIENWYRTIEKSENQIKSLDEILGYQKEYLKKAVVSKEVTNEDTYREIARFTSNTSDLCDLNYFLYDYVYRWYRDIFDDIDASVKLSSYFYYY